MKPVLNQKQYMWVIRAYMGKQQDFNILVPMCSIKQLELQISARIIDPHIASYFSQKRGSTTTSLTRPSSYRGSHHPVGRLCVHANNNQRVGAHYLPQRETLVVKCGTIYNYPKPLVQHYLCYWYSS